MNLYQEFLIIAGIICGLAGCASTSDEIATSTKAASVKSPEVSTSQNLSSSSSIYFNYDESDLSVNASSEIRQIARSLKANSSAKVKVEGHCDERGTREYNLALGERRANSVKDLLVLNGIKSSRIKTVSFGEEKPIASGSNEAAWSKNRRAVIKVY
ncbi:MAG: peptidoglycan-associated lipoprotein Pal [Gammaproteobacteria bacterium]